MSFFRVPLGLGRVFRSSSFTVLPRRSFSIAPPGHPASPLKILTAHDLDSDYYKVTVLGKDGKGTIYYPSGTETLEEALSLMGFPSSTKVYNNDGVLLSYSTPISEALRTGFQLKGELHAEAAPLPAQSNLKVARVLELLAARRVRDRLEKSGLADIEWSQYLALCAGEGLTEEQAVALSRTLHEAGVVWRLPQSLVLDVPTVAHSVEELFLAVGRKHEEQTELKKRVDTLHTELAKMDNVLKAAETRAEKFTRRFVGGSLAYLVGQTVTIGYGVWFYAGWDIMEPITFAVTLSIMLGTFTYYIHHREDYNYEHLGDWLRARTKEKILKRNAFDFAKYDQLKAELALCENPHPGH